MFRPKQLTIVSNPGIWCQIEQHGWSREEKCTLISFANARFIVQVADDDLNSMVSEPLDLFFLCIDSVLGGEDSDAVERSWSSRCNSFDDVSASDASCPKY